MSGVYNSSQVPNKPVDDEADIEELIEYLEKALEESDEKLTPTPTEESPAEAYDRAMKGV